MINHDTVRQFDIVIPKDGHLIPKQVITSAYYRSTSEKPDMAVIPGIGATDSVACRVARIGRSGLVVADAIPYQEVAPEAASMEALARAYPIAFLHAVNARFGNPQPVLVGESQGATVTAMGALELGMNAQDYSHLALLRPLGFNESELITKTGSMRPFYQRALASLLQADQNIFVDPRNLDAGRGIVKSLIKAKDPVECLRLALRLNYVAELGVLAANRYEAYGFETVAFAGDHDKLFPVDEVQQTARKYCIPVEAMPGVSHHSLSTRRGAKDLDIVNKRLPGIVKV